MWKDKLNSIISKCFDLETYKGNTGRPLEFVTRKDITDYVESLLKEQVENILLELAVEVSDTKFAFVEETEYSRGVLEGLRLGAVIVKNIPPPTGEVK